MPQATSSPRRNSLKIRAAAVERDRSLIKTAAEIFSDGSSIELVRHPAAGNLCLLHNTSAKRRIDLRVQHEGRVYVPIDPDSPTLRAVRLPACALDYGSTHRLFDALRSTLAHAGFSGEVSLALTCFVFSSWFPDVLPAAILLLITGPWTEASFLLQMLGCLVRHPLPLKELSAASFHSLPMALGLTLLVDQQFLKPNARRLLAVGSDRTAHILGRDGVVNISCPKAVYLGTEPPDAVFGDSVLHVNLSPFRDRPPILDRSTEENLAAKFQPMLVAYRLQNLIKVRDCEFDIPELPSGLRILARILGASVADAPEIQADISPLLHSQMEEVRAKRWVDRRCVVIEAALAHCHANANRIYVGEITRAANAILEGRGESGHLKAKYVGIILRTLGMVPKRDSKGFSLELTADLHRLIHRLARDFDVAAAQDRSEHCSFCTEAFAPEADSGRRR